MRLEIGRLRDRVALAGIICGLAALLLMMALAGLPAAGALPALTTTPSRTPSRFAHLPIIRYDFTPTPVTSPTPTVTATPPATPTDAPYSAAAALTITAGKAINASTFNPSSFVVANESLNGEQLVALRIDLTTAIFPDMVFDPSGAAGDTVAKDLVVDMRQGLTFEGHSYEASHDDGFDVLLLEFSSFDRGDRFEFSLDVDPTSIRGVNAPGPFESGSVGGLELVGATVTATFDDGTVLVNSAYRRDDPGAGGPDHSGAVAVLRPGLPEAPTIAIVGVATPAEVDAPAQVVRVEGPAGRPVVVLVVEGGLFSDGLPGGGFDLDPFEANSAITARAYPAVVGPAGMVDVPILLSRSLPAGGINYVTAVFDNHYGVKGATAAALALEWRD